MARGAMGLLDAQASRIPSEQIVQGFCSRLFVDRHPRDSALSDYLNELKSGRPKSVHSSISAQSVLHCALGCGRCARHRGRVRSNRGRRRWLAKAHGLGGVVVANSNHFALLRCSRPYGTRWARRLALTNSDALVVRATALSAPRYQSISMAAEVTAVTSSAPTSPQQGSFLQSLRERREE